MENISSSKLFTTRQGTVLLGVIAAVVAAIALIVYLNHYKSSVGSAQTVSVLVASKLIQQGTSGDVLRTTPGYYETKPYTKSDVESGAIQDPATLAGLTATTDISPGQQLTASDFSSTGGGLATTLNPQQRAVVVALGSPQAVGNQISAGSHVDFWVLTSASGSSGVSRPVAKLLFQDMYVLAVNGGNVTLRAESPTQAGQIIYASTNDSIWLALRPTVGTTPKPPVVSARQVTGG